MKKSEKTPATDRSDLAFKKAVMIECEKDIAFCGSEGPTDSEKDAYRKGYACGAGRLLRMLRDAHVFRPVTIGKGPNAYKSYRA